MPTRASVAHFVDLPKDQDVVKLVRITPVFSAHGNGHLVALGLGGFFLCTCLKLLVDGLGGRHGIRAMMSRDVGFDGACLAPRWRKPRGRWRPSPLNRLRSFQGARGTQQDSRRPPRLRTFSPTPAPTSGGACMRTPSPLARRWQRFADRFTQSRGTSVSWRTSRTTCGRWSRSKCDRKVMRHRPGFSVELLPRVPDEEAGASARDSKGVKGGGGATRVRARGGTGGGINQGLGEDEVAGRGSSSGVGGQALPQTPTPQVTSHTPLALPRLPVLFLRRWILGPNMYSTHRSLSPLRPCKWQRQRLDSQQRPLSALFLRPNMPSPLQCPPRSLPLLRPCSRRRRLGSQQRRLLELLLQPIGHS